MASPPLSLNTVPALRASVFLPSSEDPSSENWANASPVKGLWDPHAGWEGGKPRTGLVSSTGEPKQSL